VPAGDWKFASCDAAANPFPGTPSATNVCLKGGFDPQYLYELVYVAKDPKVMGVGLAALRDTVAVCGMVDAITASRACGVPDPPNDALRSHT